MKWHDHHRIVAVAAVLVVAGCAHDGTNNDRVTATIASSLPSATGTDAADHTATASTDPGDVKPVVTVGPATTATSPIVKVTGGPLPAQVANGYATNGGDLITDAQWAGRFGASGLPRLWGPGVTLAEAVQRIEQRDGGWFRTDEASWLAMSNDDRDTVLAAIADAAGATGTPSRTASNEEAADCVIDTYPGDDVQWTIQGCSYQRFSQMIAVGVSRTAPSDTAPTVLDPTITSVIDELNGSITFSEARFGSPGRDGSTLHLSAQVSTGVDVEAAAAIVSSGPLTGWQTFPGEGSLLVSGPTGGTWTLSDRVAVFAWAGRW